MLTIEIERCIILWKAGFKKIHQGEIYNEKKIFGFCSNDVNTYWLHDNIGV